MSFMGGAECSTAANPLSQIQKHVQDDKTLQRDRLVGRGPGGQLGHFRSQNASTPKDEMMNGFLNGAPTMQEGLIPANAFTPSQASHVLRQASSTPPPASWAQDFKGQSSSNPDYMSPPDALFSTGEYARFHKLDGPASSARSSPMQNVHTSSPGPLGGQMPFGMPRYAPSDFAYRSMHRGQFPAEQQSMDGSKGKGKLVELDDKEWEKQFAQLELQDQESMMDKDSVMDKVRKRIRAARAREDEEANAAERELDEMDRAMQYSETNEFGDFESLWKGIEAETAAARSMINDETFFDEVDNQWDSAMLHDHSAMTGDWGRFGDPIVENYLFEEVNMFRDSKNAFDEGLRVMREGGNLSLAALAFEAAVMQNPEHVEAWVYLGKAQAQNEKETAAIRAMERALKLDPNNLEALMGLAVSYTNEGYDSTAYRTLERWLSVKYPSILSAKDLHPASDMGFTDRQLLHDKVTDHFIRAAQLSPDGEHMDPDVQVGLGVLFYGAEDYDKAVDCFQSALHSSELGTSNQREQVHLLWNRLGATLANSGRSEEAIDAYEHALSLSPNFVRARYNLGVSCININCHHEAAGHFLAALDMHKSIDKHARSTAYEIMGDDERAVEDMMQRVTLEQNRSSTLYDTLRRVFTQMGRRDLAEKTVPGVDPDEFRPEFDF